jgi:hypothetical protein
MRESFTHTAYFFIRMGSRKGRVFGYWKNGGDFRQDDNEPFAFIDMVPRGGWDGRIRFVKYGEPVPDDKPQRPHSDEENEDYAEA